MVFQHISYLLSPIDFEFEHTPKSTDDGKKASNSRNLSRVDRKSSKMC